MSEEFGIEATVRDILRATQRLEQEHQRTRETVTTLTNQVKLLDRNRAQLCPYREAIANGTRAWLTVDAIQRKLLVGAVVGGLAGGGGVALLIKSLIETGASRTIP